jgi:toxin FitB
MIILDTNVLSNPYQPRPNAHVRAWLNRQSADSLYLCAPVLAELQYGIERLADGARKSRLRATIVELESKIFRDRTLAFDSSSAAEYGRLMATREREGRRMQQMDCLIAAIARAHRAAIATQDVMDFAGLGIQLVNPFEIAAHR